MLHTPFRVVRRSGVYVSPLLALGLLYVGATVGIGMPRHTASTRGLVTGKVGRIGYPTTLVSVLDAVAVSMRCFISPASSQIPHTLLFLTGL